MEETHKELDDCDLCMLVSARFIGEIRIYFYFK